MMDKITKITSVGTILLILLGVFNLQQRYYWFDIKIFDYLDASEILLSFNEIVMTIFLLMAVGGLILSGQAGSLAGETAVNNPGATVTLVEAISKSSNKKWGCFLTIITWGATILWTILLIHFFTNAREIAKWNALWFDGLYLLAMIAGLILYHASTRSTALVQFEPAVLLWSISVSLIILFAFRNYLTASLKEAGIAKYEMEIVFNDKSTLCTNNHLIYLDQSRHYLFFRQIDTNQNIIIPVEGINSIKIRQLHHGL